MSGENANTCDKVFWNWLAWILDSRPVTGSLLMCSMEHAYGGREVLRVWHYLLGEWMK